MAASSDLFYAGIGLATAASGAIGAYLKLRPKPDAGTPPTAISASVDGTLRSDEERFRQDLLTEMVRRGERIKELEVENDQLRRAP